jgi:putative ABC transport system permease protein
MLTSLDKVVLILIILASLLSFVVLYNLSSINVQERERELATLKVLGFYDKEVDSYITKENYILTFIGIAIGLFIGVYLSRFVISTVEIEKATFMKDVKLMSHIYSAALTILFTISVNYITHYALQKINMIESLKSVE